MSALKTLYLNGQTGAMISTLPSSWSAMASLQELYLHGNNIVTVPAGWSGMTELHTLYLSQNSIVSPLPPEWSNMGKLVTL